MLPISIPRHLAFLLLVSLASPALSEVRIGSWNIQHLGWDNDKSMQAVARVAVRHDFLAIQELMRAEAIEALAEKLTEKTGERWQTLYSEALGRSSYREKYAFLWRASVVEYLDDADRFAREPFSARFRVRETGLVFAAATVHITYGQRIGDRTPEIRALAAYWEWLAEIYPEDADRRILMGDFNLRPGHEAWAPLRKRAWPLITEGATTLSTTDRRFANLYDNIWLAHDHGFGAVAAGIVDFPGRLTETSERYWSHSAARDHVSDHAPVYLLVDAENLHQMRSGPISLSGWGYGGVEAVDPPEPACVDLNEADKAGLARLVHVGPARAQAISHGRPWASVDDLTRISGLGSARVAEIADQGLACP